MFKKKAGMSSREQLKLTTLRTGSNYSGSESVKMYIHNYRIHTESSESKKCSNQLTVGSKEQSLTKRELREELDLDAMFR